MLKKIIDDPTLLIAALAVLLSFVSIIMGVMALHIQRVHNRKSVKPIGNIIFSDYENYLAVNIKNTGLGPLIVKSVTVYQGDDSKNNIVDWMPMHPADLPWSSFLADATAFVIPMGESLNLIELKTSSSLSNSFAIFRDKVRIALSTLTIELSYTDIYDKKAPVSSQSLEWFGRHRKI